MATADDSTGDGGGAPRDGGGAPRDGGGAPRKAVVYLDNNATTMMTGPVIDALHAWCNRGNPSAEYASGRASRQMMDAFRTQIAVECGFELDGPRGYAVVFTSGASESNCHIVTSAVRSYAAKTGRLPHVVTSAAEHWSLLACCRRLAAEQLCQLTVLPVGRAGPGLGAVDPPALAAALRPNTCLVSIMAANDETGVLSNLREMARATRRAGVPFHTDAVQLFGRSAVRPAALGVDAFSASFHKLGGPPGVGLLVLRRALIEGYGLSPHICGSQNGGLRGGTENLPGIGASFAAFRIAMADRAEKTARVLRTRNALKAALATRVPCFYLDDHPADPPPSIDGGITPPGPAPHDGAAAARRAIARGAAAGTPVVFWVAPADERLVLPNTLLLAVRRPGFCNRAARAALEARGVIVGLGAACGAAAHRGDGVAGVVAAMGVPAALRAGVLRVSLSDATTVDDIKTFAVHFLAVVASDACLSADFLAAR
jgi:cysteine desulfurase